MERTDFNLGWKFYKEGDESGSITVDLPHDAMIHETRDPEISGGYSGSAGACFPGGLYIYEKAFMVQEDWQGKFVAFEFGGIYRNSKVFINGHEAGGRPYGYSRFFVNADPFLDYGKENTIRVVADNSQQPNSRWYSGSGIYRPVHMIVASKTHIDLDGVKVSTLSYDPAKILVETRTNGGEVHVEILDGEHVIASGTGNSLELTIENARLWSEDAPNLYRCRAALLEDGKVVDEVVESFGVRKVEWSAKGLFINGKNTLLRGGCVHHDNGVLGACAYDKAEERRVQIMKEAGYNAIRSAHNPVSQAMLEACDKFGMYMIDETWDMWYFHKSKYDYASDFEEWYLEDIKAMVDKDFNHPSVIMYSLGNEVSEPYQERGVALTQEMVKFIHELDSNRAVTAGINLMLIFLASKGKGVFKEEGGTAFDEKPGKKKKQKASGSLFFNMLVSVVGPVMNKMANSKKADMVTSPCLDALDIAGYNYASGRYPKEGKVNPDRVIFGSETMPHHIAENWRMVRKYPYLVGDFMWTSWDYLGETGIGAWSYDGSGFMKNYPWLISGTGAIDILGNIDASAKYAAVVWGLEEKPYIGVRPVNHPGKKVTKAMWRGTNAIESWAWKNCEGNKAVVEVFVDADKVELFINGKSIGTKKVKAFKTLFKTKYQPGKIKAIAYDEQGQVLYESELNSASGEISIELNPEDTEVRQGELVYVNVALVDEKGVVESNDDRKLTVAVDNGKLLGFGSANPKTEERFDSGSYTTYFGRALAVVQAANAGEMAVRVSGEGLDPGEVKIPVK